MKNKIMILLFLVVGLLFGTGITYSIFTSEAKGETNQKIASFIFNSKKYDELEFSLTDIYPSVTKEYNFSVSNNDSTTTSNVTLNYQMTIKTYHFMPLDIKLYKITDSKEEHIITCDESYTPNENNERICNSKVQEMAYDTKQTDEYKLVVHFPSQYNSEEYADLVDYIDIEISSWQKIGSE